MASEAGNTPTSLPCKTKNNLIPTGSPYPLPPPYGPWMNPPPGGNGWTNTWPGCQSPPAQNWDPTCTSSSGEMIPPGSVNNEYMVDSMRRVYSNADSSIEIERVKFHRLPQYGIVSDPPHQFPQPFPFPGYQHNNFRPDGPDSKSLVPFIGPQLPPQSQPERRPPPRKHRKNKPNNELVPAKQFQHHPYPYPPAYPMPYMPYPYPYPLPYFPYTWYPPPPPPSFNKFDQSNTDQDENRSKLSSTPGIPRSEVRTPLSITDSASSEPGRPLSPNAPSQISQNAESQTTDLAPSDSVSLGGYFRDHSGRNDKTPEWMLEMQRNLANIDDSSEIGEKSSFTTAPSDLPTPPVRRNKMKYSMKKTNTTEDNLNVENVKSEADLNYAFKKLEKSVDVFRNQVEEKISDIMNEEERMISVPHNRQDDEGGNIPDVPKEDLERRSSSASFHSSKNLIDGSTPAFETDSTDIPMATDTLTADEEGSVDVNGSALQCPLLARHEQVVSPPIDENDDPLPGEGYKWVLQAKGEGPDVSLQQGTNIWLAEVSLWRARLVVSLDKGQGLDHQDWATFHLLIQHPLPLHLKLSLLHAPRICAANTNVGAVQVRAALLQIARHAQVLLQKEDERPSGWRSITAHRGQPWMPVQGGVEMLRVLGYRKRDDGTLRYSRRLSLEASHLARLTLDLLVFADELRLYLTGQHPHPTNISDLFCPVTFSAPVTPQPLHLQNHLDSSSADFLSAESTPVMDRKVLNVSDFSQADTDASNTKSVKVDYNKQLLEHRSSSSSDDITLNEDINNVKTTVHHAPTETKNTVPSNQENRLSSATSDRLSMSTDITSLPDLQSMSSLPPSRMSNFTPKSNKQSDCSSVNTPVASPVPPVSSSISTVPHKKDDHIYEEIRDVKLQVQKLRSSVSVPNLPPPLPPKSRSMNLDDESSTDYSRSDWTATSSIGGSTGRRRRKRRAPLPPSFLYAEQIKENDASEIQQPENSMSNIDEEIDKNNPFYEEIGDNKPRLPRQDSNITNPFIEPKPKPSGYVGANPFYEDIETVKSQKAELIEREKHYKEDISLIDSTFECIFDTSDGICPPTAASRPKRKAPKAPTTSPVPSNLEPADPLSLNETESEEKVRKTENFNSDSFEDFSNINLQNYSSRADNLTTQTVVESELQDIDLNSTNDESIYAKTDAVSSSNKALNEKEYKLKNVDVKQLPSSQDVVSVKTSTNESSNFETNDELQDQSSNDTEQTVPSKIKNSDELITKLNSEECENNTDFSQKHQIAYVSTINPKTDYSESAKTGSVDSSVLIVPDLTTNIVPTADQKVTLPVIKGSEEEEEEKITSLTSNEGALPYNKETKIEGVSNLPQKISKQENKYSVEIPYIDSTDVKNYKYATVKSKASKDPIIPHIQFLRNSIPFIDDSTDNSDLEAPFLPPPPPPPMTSPPSSPPISPPETPHTSPPLTPPPIASQESDMSDVASSLTETIKTDNRLSMISECTESEDIKSVNQDQHKSPLVFTNADNDNTKATKRISNVYYEIPEAPDSPPPLPAKPKDLKNLAILQKSPEIPPKSSKVLTQITAPKPMIEDRKYETPETVKPSHDQASPIDFLEDVSISTSSCMETFTDDTITLTGDGELDGPHRPPRKKRGTPQSSISSQHSSPPPRPPKTFAGQFPGLKLQSPAVLPSSTHPSNSAPNTLSSSSPRDLRARSYTLPRSSSNNGETGGVSVAPLEVLPEDADNKHASTSTPASPRALPSRKFSPSIPEKSRKSWPFLFCECLYSNYDSKNYARK